MATKWVRKTAPGVCATIEVLRSSATEIEIGWKPPEQAKNSSGYVEEKLVIHGYEIMYEVEGQKPKRRLIDGSTESLIVKNLKPGQLVKGIVVKARNDFGWGPSTHPEISGRATSAPPGQVDWIEVVETTAFTVQLRWSEPEMSNGAPIDNYKIQQKIPGVATSEVEFETGHGDCEHVCFALEPGTPYLFTVCAQNESGWGAWVRLPAFCSTLAAPPNAPSECKVVHTTVSTVELEWRKPYSNGGDVKAYEVVYEDDVGKVCTLLCHTDLNVEAGIAAKEVQNFKISGLLSGSLVLRLRVRAKNDAGWGAFCDAVFASTSGQLMSWGENSGGQLGQKDINVGLCISRVENMEDKHVTVIAAGQFHGAAVCNGKCYTWGSNQSGQLGRYAGQGDPFPEDVQVKGYMSIHTGKAVEGVNDTLFKYPNIAVLRQDGARDYLGSMGQEAKTSGDCVSVAVGQTYTMVLTTLGEIFTFGDGSFGVLGHGTEEVCYMPRMVDSLSVPGHRVTDIFCGQRHAACIVEGGQALTWGCGLEGQLGHSSYESVPYPRKVEHLRAHRIATIACGDAHSVFVTYGGDMYSCGGGREGMLGHGDSQTFLYPKRIDTISDVVSASCGQYHTACITRGRSLYTWGSGSQGQLGHPYRRVSDQRLFSTLGASPQGPWQQHTPRCVASLSANTEAGGVLSVACGLLCTLAVTSDFSLWMWGKGPQIDAVRGSEGETIVTVPQRVSRFGSDFACNISCGSTFALAVFAKFPPGAEKRREEADKVQNDNDDEEMHEVIVDTVQEASFWAAKIGYPVILGATEHITRMYLDGVRGEEVDSHVYLCYSELSMRQQYRTMYGKEEQRMKKKKVSGKPKLMLAAIQQSDASLTEMEREERAKAIASLTADREKQAEADKTRKAAIEKIKADQREMMEATAV